MADYQLIIIGGGLSGIAAGIRATRFGLKTLLVEKHNKPGGLNSYYFRQGRLLESGLHAMTNFAVPGNKRAPLNQLFRQLKLSRKSFVTHEQYGSEIRFPGGSLFFSNDPEQLETHVREMFPGRIDRFIELKKKIASFDPFTVGPWRSSRRFLREILMEEPLEEMLLLPLMVYGNAEEHDMELSQFVIMFRSIFEEGFFRPAGTVRDFLAQLVRRFQENGGEIRYNSEVAALCTSGQRVDGVTLVGGKKITADKVISTMGMPATIERSGWNQSRQDYTGRMSFMETVSFLPQEAFTSIDASRTILFFNRKNRFSYKRPSDFIDLSWGVICFPDNFQGVEKGEYGQVRVTCAANYDLWKLSSPSSYKDKKARWSAAVIENTEQLIGKYGASVVYQDSFSPLTIERFTAKAEGAVYGSPVKVKDGRTPWENLFIAGTDQGYLGIVGAMLSGVTMVNHHVLM
ncbi:MAG: phytoene dehydrogenase [Desulfobulbus propionicus]|nr:MAG: phytoene dehydrogenase [Desulfobulbus propionicus]